MSLYRTVNSYPYLLPKGIQMSPESVDDAEVARRVMPALDEAHAKELERAAALFERRLGLGRTATELTGVARAATRGAVELLLVDIDEVVPGTIDDAGVVTLAERASAKTYDVVDEIAARVMKSGGRVMAVRRADILGGSGFAAILRYPV